MRTCRGCTCHPGSRSSTRRPACSNREHARGRRAVPRARLIPPPREHRRWRGPGAAANKTKKGDGGQGQVKGGVQRGDIAYGTRGGPARASCAPTALYSILGAARSTTGIGGHAPPQAVVAVVAELLPGASCKLEQALWRTREEKRSYFPRRSSAPAWAPSAFFARLAGFVFSGALRFAAAAAFLPASPPFAPTAARRWCARRRCRT